MKENERERVGEEERKREREGGGERQREEADNTAIFWM